MTSGRSKFREALDDPKAVYGDPERVLSDPRLDRQGKLAILQSWEADARALLVAEGEGLGGGEDSMLARVRRALRALPGRRNDNLRLVTGSGSPGRGTPATSHTRPRDDER